jgi:uncharacterized membrane protein (GlpM family)
VSSQRLIQLLLSFVVLTVVALLSERSHVLSAITAVMPLKVTIALWFIFSDSGGDPVLSSEFCRTALLALIPTAVFLLACVFGFSRTWPLGRVLLVGYAVWLVSVGAYRSVEWWLKR